jgi:hypothetical protein
MTDLVGLEKQSVLLDSGVKYSSISVLIRKYRNTIFKNFI